MGLVILIGALLLAICVFFLFRTKLKETLKALSFEALERSARSFLDISKTVFEKHETRLDALLQPMKESLEKLEEKTFQLERQREIASVRLEEQLQHLRESEEKLFFQTSKLTTALRSPTLRGTWGQLHLKRAVELAGLVEQCDFYQEVAVEKEGDSYRPDLVVRLPQNRHLVIDAKTPLDAYLEAIEANSEEERKEKLKKHAASLRKHVKDLSKKAYWKFFNLSPEFVVLFLPAESFFSSALEVDPLLLEDSAEDHVILATPTTLFALLRTIAFSWKQETLSERAQEILEVGKELGQRLDTLNDHLVKLRRGLVQSVDAFNETVASMETRLFVSVKKLKELGLSAEKQKIEEIPSFPRTVLEKTKE